MARILVVDDEAMVRGLLRRFLEGAGHEVVEAENGEDAFELHRDETFDLLITDNSMPRMSGSELIRAIRKDDQSAKIIAITAFDINEMVRHGVQGALRKPFRREPFLAMVKEVLARPTSVVVPALT